MIDRKRLLTGMCGIAMFAMLEGSCLTVFGQSSSQDSALAGHRVVVVTSHGASSVGKLTNQTLNVRTASGELAVNLDDIAYVYRGWARISNGKELLKGHLIETALDFVQGQGPFRELPVGEVVFLAPVPVQVPQGRIEKVEVIVSNGEVKKTFSTPTPGQPSKQMAVSILDEYSPERLFTLANPASKAVVTKEAKKAPFEVEFDISSHKIIDKKVAVCLGYRSSVKESHQSRETTCLSAPLSGLELAKETSQRSKHDFTCFGDVEGAGDVYLYIADEERQEGGFRGLEFAPSRRLPIVRFYKAVSNVLTMPVRFE